MRLRFLDYTPEHKLMVVPEENVLRSAEASRSPGKCMVVSVFAKGLYQVCGTRPVDPEFDQAAQKQQYELRVKRLDIEFDSRLQKIHEQAIAKKLWKGTPAVATGRSTGAPASRPTSTPPATASPPNNADRPITTREALEGLRPRSLRARR